MSLGGAGYAHHELSGSPQLARLLSCGVRTEQRGRLAVAEDVAYCRVAWQEQGRSHTEELEVDVPRPAGSLIEVRVQDGRCSRAVPSAT